EVVSSILTGSTTSSDQWSSWRGPLWVLSQSHVRFSPGGHIGLLRLGENLICNAICEVGISAVNAEISDQNLAGFRFGLVDASFKNVFRHARPHEKPPHRSQEPATFRISDVVGR